RSFELDPSAPAVQPTDLPYAARLARKYRCDEDQAQGMIDRMTEVAAADGIEMRFDRIRPGNTFDAHRLLHLAHERGKQDTLKERLFRAYLTEGEPIGDRGVLRRIAHQAGLDEVEVSDVLSSDVYAREVRADEAMARELGISGVPFFVLGGRLGVSGAQSADVLLGALERAWQAHQPAIQTYADGAICGPEGCG
ncbi:MAG: DsbA family oxidoreductase, partial [Kofleriaceae bacterium]